MASTKTLSNMLAYLRNILTSVQGGHWSQDELVAYLNSAQKDVAVKLPEKLLRGLVGNHPITIGEDETEIAHPSRYLKFIGGYRQRTTETTKRPMLETSYADIIDKEANHINTGNIDAYFADIGTIFVIYPDGDVDETMRIKYVMTPVDMSALTDTISIDDICYEWVIYYAAFLACLKDFQPRANDFLAILDKKVMETLMRFNIKDKIVFSNPQPNK